jgi:hypothetical protein
MNACIYVIQSRSTCQYMIAQFVAFGVQTQIIGAASHIHTKMQGATRAPKSAAELHPYMSLRPHPPPFALFEEALLPSMF